MNQTYALLNGKVFDKKHGSGVFGTLEWASYNANFINGCKHNCKYCYSKAMAIRFGRKTSITWKNETVRKNNLRRRFKKMNGTIMFPSSHDIHPDHLNETLEFLKNIVVAGNKVLIVTKPHLDCIRAICNMFSKFKNKILFRFTIGSSDSKILKFWEPGAPNFDERIGSLKLAFSYGFQTSVSCEPMLDNNIGEVIAKVEPFVTDAIWLGKANSLIRRLKINKADDYGTICNAKKLIECQTNDYIIQLYFKYRHDPKIKWKESIKHIVGIDVPTEKGLDI